MFRRDAVALYTLAYGERRLGALGAAFWLTCGDVFVAFKQYRMAVRCFDRSAKGAPDNAKIQQRFAWALWNAGAVDDAESAFRRLLDLSPSASVALGFATLLQEQDRHVEALNVLDRGLLVRERDPRLYNLRGMSLVALGQLENAIAAFRHAVALDETFADAIINLGAAMGDARRWDEAARWNAEAIRLRSDAPSAFNLGLALTHLNRTDEAELAFRKAIAFDTPRTELTTRASARLALAIGQQGRSEEALDHAERLFRSDPGDVAARNILCSMLVGSGQNERALKLAKESVRLYPADFRVYLSLGWALLTSGDANESLATFDRAAALTTGEVSEVQAGRGSALSALGRHREALEVFEQLIAADPRYLERDMAGEYYRKSHDIIG